MPTVIEGARFTGGTQGITAARVVSDLGDVLLLEPNKAPLCVLTMKLNKKKLISHKCEWQEDVLFPDNDTVDDTTTTNETTLTPANPTYFTVGDVVKVPRTGDVMRVDTQDGTNINVTRVSGNNTLAADEPVYIIGSAFYQGAAKANRRSVKVDTVTNWAQIFKRSFGISKTLKASKVHGGDEERRLKRKTVIEFAKDMEYSALLGLRGSDETGTAPIYYSGGFFQYVSTAAVSVGGSLTMTKVDDLSRQIFRYGSKTKLLLCGYKVINGINRLARADLRTLPKDETYGIDIKELLTGYGRLLVHNHWLLDGATYAGYGLAVDLANFEMRVLRGIQYEEGIQAAGADELQNQYIAELGWKVPHEKSHGYLYGVTG